MVNEEKVGEAKFAHVPPGRYSATESFDIGEDTGEAVSTQYEGPFPSRPTPNRFRKGMRIVTVVPSPTSLRTSS